VGAIDKLQGRPSWFAFTKEVAMHKLFILALAAQGFLIYFTVDATARQNASPAFKNCESRCAGKYIDGTTGLPPSPSGYRRCANHCKVVYPLNSSAGETAKRQHLPAGTTAGSRNSKKN
jgi:hypothetical protein